MSDQNKIVRKLSADELHIFIARCAAEPNLTLKRITEIAAEWGIDVSVMGAKSFRDTTFTRHLERLRSAQQVAQMISVMQQNGAESTLADASATLLAQKIFETLSGNGETEDDTDLTDERVELLSRAVARLRSGDQQGAALKAKLAETEQRIAERKLKLDDAKARIEAALAAANKAKDGVRGIDPKTLEEIESALNLM